MYIKVSNTSGTTEKKAVILHILEFKLCYYRHQFIKILNLSTKTTRQNNKEHKITQQAPHH